MSVISSRTGHRGRRGLRSTRVGLAAAMLGLLLVSACGMGAQTLRPYTPSEGVNFDVGNLEEPDSVVHVRNLLVISRSKGTGIVSASMVTRGEEALTGISGKPYKPDGTPGAPFTAELPSRIPLSGNALVVLTEKSPLVTVSSPDLVAGLDAEVTLTFGKAGTYTTRVPVVDGNEPPYEEIDPSASPSPSPTTTVTPSTE